MAALTLATLVGRRDQYLDQIDDLQKEIKAIKKQLETTEEKIFARMNQQGITSYKGESGRGVVIRRQEHPNIEDWDALTRYVKRWNEFSLFQRRVSKKRWLELTREGRKVPGIGVFTKRTLASIGRKPR